MEHVVISNRLQLLALHSGSVGASMGGSAGTTTAGPLIGEAEEEAGLKGSLIGLRGDRISLGWVEVTTTWGTRG